MGAARRQRSCGSIPFRIVALAASPDGHGCGSRFAAWKIGPPARALRCGGGWGLPSFSERSVGRTGVPDVSGESLPPPMGTPADPIYPLRRHAAQRSLAPMPVR